MAFIKRHPDLIASLALVAALFIYAAAFVHFDIPPFEDAAMLMRYADHLAHGYGIVWNIGEPPVDGATDFLFMVLSAALIRIGLPVGRAIRILGLGAHLVTVLVVYWSNRKLWSASIPVSLFSALYLTVGTGLSYVAAYFGTPVFALCAALAWVAALLLIKAEEPSFLLCLLFAFAGLLTGLVRPEGVILAALMLGSVIVIKGWRGSAKIVLVFAAVFLVLGGAYFLWRWNYFGHPLPNPFYKKGGGFSHIGSLQGSWLNVLRLCAPFWIAFVLAFRSPKTAWLAMAFLLPIAAFTSAFVLISDETNFGARFQYALVPLVLICWFPLVEGGLPAWPAAHSPRERRVRIGAVLAAAAALLLYAQAQNCFLTSVQQSCSSAYESDGRYELAKLLSDYEGKGYVIATSEAGLLPFYSGWSALDTWGLNDAWIARNGEVTEQYLDLYKPQVIAFHAYFSPLVPPKLTDKNLSQPWYRMTITLMDYAEKHGYILAAAFGDSPYEAHYYYVSPDFPDSARIVKQIAGLKNYHWPATGKKSLNFAGFIER
jgi:hypothetical protein